MIQENLNHLYHPVTCKRETYEKLKLRHPKRWITSMSNELGRLDSGVVDIMTSGTDTIFFIHKNQVPAGREAKYANSVYDYRPLKDNSHHVRLTVGGDRLIYPGGPIAPTESLLD